MKIYELIALTEDCEWIIARYTNKEEAELHKKTLNDITYGIKEVDLYKHFDEYLESNSK